MFLSLKTETVRRTGATVLLAVLVLCLYMAFPTRNHYWDGIGFALNIEGVPQDATGHYFSEKDTGRIYYNPNHLLYNAVGRAVYLPLKQLFPHLRALDVLVGWSVLSAVGVIVLVQRMLAGWTGQVAQSCAVSLVLAFSATWWKFSTDASTYVPSTLLLVVSCWMLVRGRSSWMAGVCHAGAMLLHQIAIFFWPAALAALWWRGGRKEWRSLLAYSLGAGIPVGLAYLWVWSEALEQPWDLQAFLRWVTFNGSDVYTYKSWFANLAESLRSLFRLFFGGKVSLARHFVPLPLLVALALGAVAGLVLVIRYARWQWMHLEQETKFLLVWAGSYLLFLFVWLTEYPYYRIFCLPAVAMLVGLGLRRMRVRAWSGVVLTMACVNFALYVYPFTKVEASPPIRVALEAREIWGQDVVVYYSDFNCDNWWMKYFNSHTTWKRADLDAPHNWVKELEATLQTGQKVYLDAGVLEELKNTAEVEQLLTGVGKLGTTWGIRSAKHKIQFAELQRHSGD